MMKYKEERNMKKMMILVGILLLIAPLALFAQGQKEEEAVTIGSSR